MCGCTTESSVSTHLLEDVEWHAKARAKQLGDGGCLIRPHVLSRYEARPEALLPPGRGPVLRARLISSTSAESNKKAIANASLSLPRFWCSRVVRSRRLRMMHSSSSFPLGLIKPERKRKEKRGS